jgi:hypothetical protein
MFDLDSESTHFSNFKAARAVIVERYHGEVLEGTAETVETSSLDREGRYRRIATGWGELS